MYHHSAPRQSMYVERHVARLQILPTSCTFHGADFQDPYKMRARTHFTMIDLHSYSSFGWILRLKIQSQRYTQLNRLMSRVLQAALRRCPWGGCGTHLDTGGEGPHLNYAQHYQTRSNQSSSIDQQGCSARTKVMGDPGTHICTDKARMAS